MKETMNEKEVEKLGLAFSMITGLAAGFVMSILVEFLQADFLKYFFAVMFTTLAFLMKRKLEEQES